MPPIDHIGGILPPISPDELRRAVKLDQMGFVEAQSRVLPRRGEVDIYAVEEESEEEESDSERKGVRREVEAKEQGERGTTMTVGLCGCRRWEG